MNMRSTIFCSLIAVGTVAHAEGFYVLGSAGESVTKIKDISKSDLDDAFDIVAQSIGMSASTNLDRTDSAYKLQAGYQFATNFALEGGYVKLGKTEYKYTLTDGVNDLSGSFSYETKGWNLDGVLILPVNAGISVFGKAGLVRAQTKFKGDGLESQDTTKIAPTFGAGIAWNFWQGLSARIEWERFVNLNKKDIENLNSRLDVDLFTAGLSYQF